MRKFFAAAAVAAMLVGVCTVNGSAQTIGFKVGPTFSKIHFDPAVEDNNETLTSFGGGGFIRFGTGPHTLQAEVLAVTKGLQSTDTTDVNGTAKLKLSYVEIPITAVFKLGNGPYLFAGPSVAFESSCKISLEFDGGSFSGKCDESGAPSEDSFVRKKTDFGVTGGAGLQVRLGPGSILVEGRYTHGLTDLNNSTTETTKIYNRSFAAFAGYAISIGRH